MRFIRRVYFIIETLVKRLLSLLELFLFLRLVLRYLNANPMAFVVNLIYRFTDIFISPFEFIFPDIYRGTRVIDTTTLSAMVGYVIFTYVFLKLINIFSRD